MLTKEDLQELRINILSNGECKSIKDLFIGLDGNLLLLRGIAKSFVSKQKAQVVAMRVLAAKACSSILTNEIQVVYDSQS